MFKTILIANRGEIAVRVIRTARAMGIRSVAVHSDADAGAMHVRLADHAVRIGPAPVAESYLDGAAIIAAAKSTGAEAIHPGYGFLSENPDFVEAVAAAGLSFIGPSAEAIRAMGLKGAAKALMSAAGVPVVPGYHGEDQDPQLLQAEAGRIGYPVLVKAVAGGGGKGMRLDANAEGFAEAQASARAEARTAFGNDAVLIEKFVQNPRHIEVQVFGDGTSALHLFERDCSLQRRHQKVIEEAPAPGMTAKMREAMGAAAVRAAEAIGYKGAGTVEFIVDGSDGLRPDRFWFMEMNTRLQVEHPVTEAITGIDLVEWQLRVAAGEPLPARQDDLRINGHAFEARLYAEDVPAGFLPATGQVTHLAFGAGARADTGVAAGDAVSPWYDPMIAKIIVHGADRAGALQKLALALAGTGIAGVTTNRSFLARLAAHPGLVSGRVDTGLIGRDLAALAAPVAVTPPMVAQAALMAAGLDAGGDAARGFALWQPLNWAVELLWDSGEARVLLTPTGPDSVDLGFGERVVQARRRAGHWRFDGAAAEPAHGLGRVVTLLGSGVRFVSADPLDRESIGHSTGDQIRAPMPGLVREVAAQAGQKVTAGQRLVVLEAMKMEHVLRAPRDGVVALTSVSAGDQVEAGDVVLELEAGA